MPGRAKRWARRVLRRETTTARCAAPQTPTLSPSQRRPLTATPSDESLVASALTSTRSSPFFRLPPDIRESIFMEAFGGRFIHMDTSIVQKRVCKAFPWTENSGAVSGLHNANIWNVPLAVWGKKTVCVWCSSVCRRTVESPFRPDRIARGEVPQPFDCACHLRWATQCMHWPEDVPTTHRLGVMGWLLSCRQA